MREEINSKKKPAAGFLLRDDLQSMDREELENLFLDLQEKVRDPQEEDSDLSRLENRYWKLFDSIDEGFGIAQVFMDASGNAVGYKFLETNSAFDRQLGLVNEQGSTMQELVPNIEKYWYEFFGKVAASGKASRVQNYSKDLDRWFDIYSFPFGEPHDDNHQVGILFKDITEQKDAAEKLRGSEERFRALVTSGANVVYSMGPDWKGMRQLHGKIYIPDTLEPGSNWVNEYVLGDDLGFVQHAINEAIRTKSVFHLEHRVRLEDGTIGWVSSRAVPLLGAQGEITEWVGSANDITEKKRALEELRQSEERFRALVTASSLAVYSMNKDFSELQQLSGQDFLPDTTEPNPDWLAVYVYSEDQPKVLDIIQEAITTKNMFTVEHRVRRIDGSIGYALSRAVPRMDASGNITEWFGAMIDLTEWKHDEELNRHAQALEIANRELETFSYSVAHDLRSPVTTIMGFSDFLLEEYAENLDATGKDYIGRIKEGANKMNSIIHYMFILSNASRQEIELETVDLHDVARQMFDQLCRDEPQRKVKITIQKDLLVQADPKLMEMMLENLMGNAWKFTGHRQDGHIEVGSTGVANERVFFVRDNGSGFDNHLAEKIFIPFMRAHSTREFPGTGIGLTIVERIIRRHGGRIWAEGEAEVGATFYFTLEG